MNAEISCTDCHEVRKKQNKKHPGMELFPFTFAIATGHGGSSHICVMYSTCNHRLSVHEQQAREIRKKKKKKENGGAAVIRKETETKRVSVCRLSRPVLPRSVLWHVFLNISRKCRDSSLWKKIKHAPSAFPPRGRIVVVTERTNDDVLRGKIILLRGGH